MTTSASTPTETQAGTEETTDPGGPGFVTDPSVRVWDLPLRLTHWSFALLVPALWWSAENSQWALHKRFGIALLGLLVFRLLWGFLGTRTARFRSFVKGPGAVLAYVTGRAGAAADKIGHNPLGALSVLGLLAVMMVQVGSGLFAGDPFDGATGPLNPLVGVATADALTEWHEWFYWVVLGFVALHLSAITFYAVVRQNDLVSPMLSGRKLLKGREEENEQTSWVRFLVSGALAAALALWVALGAPGLS
ncbi:MAG: cytochrome b/b6 domain-containing protein [Erythrobacter sp.]|uniref:cytochrome b/b6 domain-containing protein n=1 Tax=Erythrobacter sp. TaxID=1042 RepID=UPI0026206EEA|nr:cytochrome b/b6 domain-containing protein [Erythrobacter sp.]MDJ0977378.1 cytochrome b/b6 domain-containing protein [Erythrobacter sp.]